MRNAETDALHLSISVSASLPRNEANLWLKLEKVCLHSQPVSLPVARRRRMRMHGLSEQRCISNNQCTYQSGVPNSGVGQALTGALVYFTSR